MKDINRILKQSSLTPREASLVSNEKYSERDIFLMCKNKTSKFKFVQPIGMELYYINTKSFIEFLQNENKRTY